MTTESRSKVMALGEAVKCFIRPGASIHLAYVGARPNAAVAEVVRQFRGTEPDFTVITHGLVNMQMALLSEGLVGRLLSSFIGENYPKPYPNRIAQELIASGEVEVENWSMWSLTARLMAAALDLPHFPVRSLWASDIGEDRRVDGDLVFETPEADAPVALVNPLHPDVVLLQGAIADTEGNVVLPAPRGEGAWGTLAAKDGVIACVEEVVASDELGIYASQVAIPPSRVLAVCHVPFGSHPYGSVDPTGGLGRTYIEDDVFMRSVQDATGSMAAFEEWVEEWMHGVEDHPEYLRKLGQKRLEGLALDKPDSAIVNATPEQADGPQATVEEQMIVTVARMIMERVAREGFDFVLGGIGLAHLGSWLASRLMELEDAPVRPSLMAESGMVDFHPVDGDPFLFASRQVVTSAQIADIPQVLGSFLPGPGTRTLGVLGAGQIDEKGNLNSTWTENHRYIVGSGGANDIASSASEVIVVLKHSPRRLVEIVPYITAPGTRVSTIITDLCVLERDEDEFSAVKWFGEAGTPETEIVDHLQSQTGWPIKIGETFERMLAPTAEEIRVLRRLDPDGLFTRHNE